MVGRSRAISVMATVLSENGRTKIADQVLIRGRGALVPIVPQIALMDGENMITGMHVVIHTCDAEVDRAFFRDVLGLTSVDAGGGWLIFAAPPSEVACHPAASNDRHELRDYPPSGRLANLPRMAVLSVTESTKPTTFAARQPMWLRY